MRMKSWHEVQNDNWYDRYLDSQREIDRLETILAEIEDKMYELENELERDKFIKMVKDLKTGA